MFSCEVKSFQQHRGNNSSFAKAKHFEEMRRDETGRFLVVGVSRVSPRRLVSKTSFSSSPVVFGSFYLVNKYVWYFLVSSRRLVWGSFQKLPPTEN